MSTAMPMLAWWRHYSPSKSQRNNITRKRLFYIQIFPNYIIDLLDLATTIDIQIAYELLMRRRKERNAKFNALWCKSKGQTSKNSDV